MRAVIIAVAICLGFGAASAQTLETSAGKVTVTKMIGGLDTPWALEFLPGGGYVFTEREGSLFLVKEGKATKIKGTPSVVATGQGGLLDVMIPRDFAQTREIFLSYSKNVSGGVGAAVAVGILSADNTALTNVREIFQMNKGSGGGRHFGSRIVEARDGSLFVTLGERGDRPAAQDLSRHHGSVIRIQRDGSVPRDNPYVGNANVLPEIYSYGHRNPQGASLDAAGALWVAEHGAQGGDEVNRIKKGANFGWPVISYGRHYSGAKIGEGSAREGMEQPEHYWDPSIAPSGLMIYSGKLWPEWKGNLFVGSLKFDYISRLSGGDVGEVEQIKGEQTERVRDIVEGPDGAIWFISEGQGAIYRITP
ncbi:PQQ-dependent sugar dehydrogenase [Falsihalocynthiibacter sp. SS001]|uniref:PQQ-dependent sugar dehydrogenase n=1 Tax=Falsihalocynthiibacter sp. SS001 TaxID=3349698 RepID=UPI0036D43E93